MKAHHKPLYLLTAIIVLSTSCAPLKPYERIYVDDAEMQLTVTSCKSFEHYVQSIREGAMSNGGAKGSGGCGCN